MTAIETIFNQEKDERAFDEVVGVKLIVTEYPMTWINNVLHYLHPADKSWKIVINGLIREIVGELV